MSDAGTVTGQWRAGSDATVTIDLLFRALLALGGSRREIDLAPEE